MENLVLSFNVILPLFLSMCLGYGLKRIGMLSSALLKGMNQLCFKVFLPFYLFNNVYNADLGAAFYGKLIAFAIGAVVIMFVVLMVLIPRVEQTNARRGVMVQGIFRSNFALFGLPLAISLCGEANAGPTSLLVGIIVPVYNVLAVVALESFRGGKPNARKILRGILTNPLIIASVLGIAAQLLGLRLPSGVEKTVTDLGRVATPLSLVALGGEFTFASVRDYRKQLCIVLAGKLVLAPLVMVAIGIGMGLRGEWLVPILVMFGAPTAVSSFPMAQQMDGDGELAASVVVFTSSLCVLTMFVFIFLLKQLMLI